MYDFRMRCLFWARSTLLYDAHVEQENYFDDNFIEDQRIFLLSSFLSTFDTPFSGCQQYSLITNYEDDSVGMLSCCCFQISYYLS